MEDESREVKEPDFAYGGSYTYADYLMWTIEERFEIIKGKLFKMSPAPNRRHQSLSMSVSGQLWSFLKGQKCQVFSAPFDVRLPKRSKEDKEIFTVVQPDICVVCDPAKLDNKGCIGAPDLIVEILSPGNNSKELRNKYDIYEEHGVKEYWVISPQDQTLLIYTIDGGLYKPSRLMTTGDVATSAVLPGFSIDLTQLFENE